MGRSAPEKLQRAAAGGQPFNLSAASLGVRAADPRQRDRPAFSFVDAGDAIRTWSYGEAWETARRFGRALLQRGLSPGDRLLIRLPHSPDYAFTFFGAAAAGLVPIPASPQLTEEEASFLIEDAEAAAIVVSDDLRLPGQAGREIEISGLHASEGDAGAPELPATRPGDPAFLIYTSGTTALPKGVLHAHRAALARRFVREGWHGMSEGDVTLHAGTLNWSYTLVIGLMDPWLSGAHAVLAEGPSDPRRWPALMERLGVTIFASVPTVYRQMLKYARPEGHHLSRLRHVLCAGEPLSPALLADWRERVGTEMYECLGMTEISTYISSGPSTPVRPGSPGRAQPGRRVTILPVDPADGSEPLPAGQVGLLAVDRSDPGLMLGYWRRPEEEAAVFRDEWFVGGDLASMDDDGYIWFQGRADDVIKSFGYRISPVEVEAVLEHFPGVSEAAVVGLEIEDQKTLVAACVVPQPGTRLDEGELSDYAAEHLARYKQPRLYRLMESLPRTRNGKVQRRVLIERLRAGPGDR